ncbi:hypothetical protein [Herbaspirillum rubrisubalbicans]|uniref:Uncharacterized protein n=1 Tax=Herbaspirillum rubrisubalbicans TaxID=80842 RepID=A0AAD0U4K0_9BURK|nr:hypothetical protein [Herbaspirillum rubrisubalbicans]AYR23024.1 hypothetical protein RC54_03960 [Herbaspirillum rubrisubalbicans]
MPSAVSICSNALLKLGAKTIASFAEGSDHATLASNLFPSVRDSMLRAHYWNCAIKRVLLSPLTQTPAFDFAYQFSLPGDWIRTVQVGRKGYQIPYRSEGRNILSDAAQLPLVYVFRNENPASWSTNFIRVMEQAMAAEMAYAVTASSSLRDSMNAELQQMLKVAKAIDGQDDPPEEFEEGSLVESRFS